MRAAPAQVGTLVAGLLSFLACLAAYFSLLPLRDEAGVSLGTAVLPTLFGVSLLLTLVATPFASLFLSRNAAARERGVQQLFRCLAFSVLGACTGLGRGP